MKQRPSIQEQGTDATFQLLPLNFLRITAFSSDAHEASKAHHVGSPCRGPESTHTDGTPGHWGRQRPGVNPSR